MPIAEVNGININYESHGDPSRPCVVLIGGLGSQITSWATQVPLYSKQYRVIVFDNRGAGKSEKPLDPYTTRDMAADTIALLDHLGVEMAFFVGKSMGGMIAQWIGIDYPDRVLKLVMGCSSASRDQVGNEILRVGREIAEKSGMKTVWLMALFLGYTRKYIENNIESIKTAMSYLEESDEALSGYKGQSNACEQHDTRTHLHTINAPTLVMLGATDMIASPDRSRELAELIPDSKLLIFEDVGHGFWRERQPEVDRAVLEFIDD